jgi:hypothetical protein
MSNPFATCWTRPGALPFFFADGQSAEMLVRRLANNNWRGAIVGPHGSGKSTLLKTLVPLLAAAGRRTCGQEARRRAGENDLVVVDGFEQLGRIARWRLTRDCRRNGAGLLVTTHHPAALPTLIALRPDFDTVRRIVSALGTKSSLPQPIDADLDERFARCRGNVRELLFELYEQHERRRAAARTSYGLVSYENRRPAY